MGLAASQARFLGITARKNACELRSMEIAQERLSISNQLSQASQNYMTSLNATKLIWNPERTDDFVFQLDYTSMTRPSVYNDYQLQLLTNIKGQTVLDTSFYDALRNASFTGIDGASHSFDDYSHGGIERSTDNFIKFIDILKEEGVLNNAQVQQINAAIRYQNETDANGNLLHPRAKVYLPDNGFGACMSTAAEIYSTDVIGLCEYVDEITNIHGSQFLNDLYETYGSNPLAPTPYDNANETIRLLNFDDFDSVIYNLNGKGVSVVTSAITSHSSSLSEIRNHMAPTNWDNVSSDWVNQQEFNFADVMGNNTLALVGWRAYNSGAEWAAGMDANYTGFVTAIDAFVDNLVNIAKNFFEYDSDEDSLALERTRRIIENLYKNADGSLRTTDANYTTSSGGLSAYRNYFMPILQTGTINGDSNYALLLDLANFAQAFFTEYENQRTAGATQYNVSPNGDLDPGHENTYLVTEDPLYCFDYVDAGTSIPNGEIAQILNYYSQMFNQICVKGFVYNPAVDDADKMQNMIKNGSLAVSSIGDDNYFYQYDYMAYGIGGGYFTEVPDEDAITLAEAEYKVKQAQLNAKEEELSVDMQNIEAELAALSTEYDTVKNLINKSVQKDFTTCGGG